MSEQKKAFTAAQVKYLSEELINKAAGYDATDQDIRNAALFRMAICSMLRSSDLLNLRNKDVWNFDEGGVKESFTILQKKTGNPVTCYLSDVTVKEMQHWMHYNSGSALYICDDPEVTEEQKNTVFNYRVFEISDRQYRNIVSGWAKSIGLNPKHYSTHSLRRTKPKEVYAQTQNIEMIRRMLGHGSIKTTSVYLGVEQEEVEQLAKKIKL